MHMNGQVKPGVFSDVRVSPFPVMSVCENIHTACCVSLDQHLLTQFHQILRAFRSPSPQVSALVPTSFHIFLSLSSVKENPKEC